MSVGERAGGKNAAAAPTSHSEFFSVDVPTLQEFVHTDHQVAVIVARIVILNDVSGVLAVAGRATRVEVEDDVSPCRHPLKFVIKYPAVASGRPTVDVKN